MLSIFNNKYDNTFKSFKSNAAFYWVHSTDAIYQRTGKQKISCKTKALGHVKEACFDSYDVFNMNMYLEFCG